MPDLTTRPDGDLAALAGVITDLTVAAGGVIETDDQHGDHALVLVPGGYQVHAIDRTPHRDHPPRAAGNVVVHDTDSFLALLARHANPATVVYVDPTATSTAVAVFDDHAAGQPGWRGHTATLSLRNTTETDTLTRALGNKVTHEQLAQLVDDLMHVIVEPAAADLADALAELQVLETASVRSVVRLDASHVALTTAEDSKATTSSSTPVPTSMRLLLALYEGTDPVPLTVKMQYRPERDGKGVSVQLRCPDLPRVVRDVVRAEVAKIQASAATSALVVSGRP